MYSELSFIQYKKITMFVTNPTAAIIIIGNEILSGFTIDTNTQEIALSMNNLGIILSETKTIPDNKEMIIEAVRQFSDKYDYVFTTGGIGPTHDDITAESVAAAFDLKYTRNNEIYNILKKFYKNELDPSKEKMAYIPESAKLIYCKEVKIPCFVTKNIFSIAGTPRIMKSMLNSIIPLLKKGDIIESRSLKIMIPESKIADKFQQLQYKYKDVDMGSYTFRKNNLYGTNLILRSSNYKSLNFAFDELKKIISLYNCIVPYNFNKKKL